MDEQALLATIAMHPDEKTPRMMLADYLLEHGRDQEASDWQRPPHRQSPFASLVGRTVQEVWLSDDTLTLLTDDGPYSYPAHADCCSESWYYRVLNADRLIGSVVCAVAVGREDDVNPTDGLGRQESDSVYGYCLLTEKGGCEITFRNSSNGYYGGWLEVERKDYRKDTGWWPVHTSWVHPPATKMGCSKPTDDCQCEQCLFPIR